MVVDLTRSYWWAHWTTFGELDTFLETETDHFDKQIGLIIEIRHFEKLINSSSIRRTISLVVDFKERAINHSLNRYQRMAEIRV